MLSQSPRPGLLTRLLPTSPTRSGAWCWGYARCRISVPFPVTLARKQFNGLA